MSLLPPAIQYRDAGLSIIGSSKKGSVVSWKEYQQRLPNDKELEYFFTTRNFQMLAIICGPSSGNLEVIDVDTKNDSTGTLWDRLWSKIMDYYNQQPPFPIVQTPSGGIHIYYRCETIAGNKKLATLEGGKEAVIETRGIGGLVMAPPSNGYKLIAGNLLTGIPTISLEERDDILAICLEFNQVHDEPEVVKSKASATYKKTPWSEYNEADDWKDVLVDAGWKFVTSSGSWDYWRRPGKEEGHSASWNKETRQFYVFSSSTGFVIQKGYRPFDIYKTINCAGDVRKAIQGVKSSGYGLAFSPQEEAFIGKAVVQFNSGNLMDDIRDMLAFDFETAFRSQRDVDMEQLLDAAKSRSMGENDIFWLEDEKGNLKLDKAAFKTFLVKQGYRLFVQDEHANSYRLIRIQYEKHWAYPIEMDVFRKELERWIEEEAPSKFEISKHKLQNFIMGFSKDLLNTMIDFLPRINFDDMRFLKKAGDEDCQWFTFRNTALKVTKHDYIPVPYNQLEPGMVVWKKDIKPFDFELSDIELESEFNQSVIWLFFKRISGITKDIQHLDHIDELPVHHPELSKRFNALITAVGYLMSAHKDEDQPYAPIFEEDTETSAKGGGTGKGLIFKILGLVRNVANIDCKVWDPKDKFAFEEVDLDTDVIHLEDTEPNFKISVLNNFISSGITMNRKFEKRFKLSYADSPKIAVSTNYKVNDDADFEARRQKKIYLARYFNKNYRPKQELGMIFGKSWKDADYQLCYNILFYCLHMYMNTGIADAPPTLNVMRKYVEEEFKVTFLHFMDRFIQDNKGQWIKTQEAYQEFLERSGEKERYYSIIKFSKGLKVYGDRLGYKFEAMENDSRKVGERGKYYFIFTTASTEIPPFETNFIKGEIF